MASLIASILGTLLQNGLPKVAQVLVDKGQDYVEEKLGVKLEPDMSQAQIHELKLRALQHEEFLVEQEQKNTADARDMNEVIQSSSEASWLSKNSAYLLDFLIIVSTIIVSGLAFFVGVPLENKELVYMALGSLLTMTGTVLNFHRGSSSGSAKKTELLGKGIQDAR